LFVVLLALAVLITLTRNWNAWEGGKVEQATDDAIVRGDLTPLSTKVAGIVRSVRVSDYQRVRAGELLVELQDDDYQAQLAQAGAAVEAAKAAIENNRRQRELQDSRIQRALAGIDWHPGQDRPIASTHVSSRQTVRYGGLTRGLPAVLTFWRRVSTAFER